MCTYTSETPDIFLLLFPVGIPCLVMQAICVRDSFFFIFLILLPALVSFDRRRSGSVHPSFHRQPVLTGPDASDQPSPPGRSPAAPFPLGPSLETIACPLGSSPAVGRHATGSQTGSLLVAQDLKGTGTHQDATALARAGNQGEGTRSPRQGSKVRSAADDWTEPSARLLR